MVLRQDLGAIIFQPLLAPSVSKRPLLSNSRPGPATPPATDPKMMLPRQQGPSVLHPQLAQQPLRSSGTSLVHLGPSPSWDLTLPKSLLQHFGY